MPPSRDVITVVAPWRFKGADPLVSGYLLVRMGCLETLTGSDGKGGVTPRLARSWEVSADGKTWRILLRQSVRFHDGTALTAEGTADCLRRAFRRDPLFASAALPIESVRALNEREIAITCKEPFAPLPAYLAHYTTAVVPSRPPPSTEAPSVTGTGCYRLVSSEMGTLLQFEAFPDYWGSKPLAPVARYLAVENAETRAMMAESGEADLALTLSVSATSRLSMDSKVAILNTVMPRVRIIQVNTHLPFFQTRGERQAFSMAIDRERIAHTLLGNPQMAATQLLPPSVARWHDPGLAPLAYDPQEALRIFERNGWERGPDGFLRKDGNPFSVEMLTYSSRPMLPLIAQALQAQLREIGIRMDIAVVEAASILQRHQDGTLCTALYSQNFGLVPDPVGVVAFDFGPAAARWGWGALGWESPRLNRLIGQYLSTFDAAFASKIRKGILHGLQQELPLIPVTWYDHRAAVSRRLQGVQLDPYELRPYLEGVTWAP